MSGSSSTSPGLNVAAKPFVPSFAASSASRLNPTARAFVPSFDTATAAADPHTAADTDNTAATGAVPSSSASSPASDSLTVAASPSTSSVPSLSASSAPLSSPPLPLPLSLPLPLPLPLPAPSARRSLASSTSAKIRKPKSLQDDDDTADRRSSHSYNSRQAIGSIGHYGLTADTGGGRPHSRHENGVSFSSAGGSGPLPDGGVRQYSLDLLLSLRSLALSQQWPIELDDGCDAIVGGGKYNNHAATNGAAPHDGGNNNNSKRQSGGGAHGNELFRSSDREKDSGANSAGWRDTLTATLPSADVDGVPTNPTTIPVTAASSSPSPASVRPALSLRPSTSLRPGASAQSSVGRLKNKQASFQSHDKQGGGQQGGRGSSSSTSAGGQQKDGGSAYSRKGKDAPLDIEVAPLEKTERRYTVVKDIPPDAKLLRALNAILNKLTPEKFETLLDQVLALKLTNVGLLRDVVTAIFEKALAEPNFSPTYAQFCVVLSDKLPTFADDEGEQTFRKLILNRCQAEFEAENHTLSEQQLAGMSQEDKEQHTAMVKRRTLGTIRFIGELYIRQLIASRIMRHCFPESDTRVLTNHGYLFLDEIEGKLRQQQTVLYACYEVKKRNHLVESKELKYSRGKLVIPADDGQPLPEHLLEFTSPDERARWAKGSDPYGKDAVPEDNPNRRHVSLRVTPDHTMFVQYGDEDKNGVIAWGGVTGERGAASSTAVDEHVKVPASSLRSTNDRAHIRTLACAEAGYVPPSTNQRDAVMSALGLTRKQFTAFLELFGFWLGDGFIAYRKKGSGYNGVVFSHVKQTDQAWLQRKFKHVGLSQRFMRCDSPKKGAKEHLVVTHSAWFDLFDSEFGCRYRNSKYYQPPPTSTSTSTSTVLTSVPTCEQPVSHQWVTSGFTSGYVGSSRSSAAMDQDGRKDEKPAKNEDDSMEYGSDSEDGLSNSDCTQPSDWSEGDEWSEVESEVDVVVEEDLVDEAEGDGEKQAPPSTNDFVPEPLKSHRWLPDWVLAELSGDEMRQLIKGLHRADGSFAGGVQFIHTSGTRFRDQLMQALLHCGCSAYVDLMHPAGTIRGYKFHNQAKESSTYSLSDFDSFSREQQRLYTPIKATVDVWTVNWAEPDSNSGEAFCWPSLPRRAGITRAAYSAARDGRIWCVEVEHADHLIFAQRAHRTRGGAVTKQSRPIVVGNCITLLFGDINAPVEEDIEALCRLLDTTGKFLEHSKGKDMKVNHDFLHTTLAQLSQLKERRELLSSRIRFMIADVLDVQKNGWVNRRAADQAKKISAVHEEAAKHEREAAQQAELQRMYQSMQQQHMPHANRPSPASRMARPTDRYALPQPSQNTPTQPGQWEMVGGGKSAKQGTAASAVAKHTAAPKQTTDSETNEEVNAYALLNRRGGREEKEQEDEEEEEEDEDEDEDDEREQVGHSNAGKHVGSSALSADDIRDRASALVKELCSSEDVSDALLTVEELGAANCDDRFIESLLLAAMEAKKESHKLLVCRLLTEASKRTLLSSTALEAGVLSLLTQLDDIAIDLPKCDEYCAMFIAQLAADCVLSLSLLTPARLQSVASTAGAATRFFLLVLQQMKRLTGGEEAVVAAVRRAQTDSAQPLQLLPLLDRTREQAHKLLVDKKLEQLAQHCIEQ